MNKYNKIVFVNGSAPPLNADNLNHMDEGIERATDGAIALETEITTARGDSADLNTRFTADEASIEAVKSEIATARGGQNSLGARLDTVDTNLTNKADKATTLAGYGITDAYTKEKTDQKLAQKLNSMPFDSEPKYNSPCYLTSGAVYNALLDKVNSSDVETSVKSLSNAIKSKADINAVNALNEYVERNTAAINGKYDSSNVEVGKGELTPAQAIYNGFEGSFNYSKIGETVTVALNITNLVAGKNYVRFTGLPFRAMAASRLSSVAVYTTANKLANIRLDYLGLHISSPGTTFAEGEKINVIVTYIIG